MPSKEKKPWQQSGQTTIKPKLSSDSTHVPKTHGSLGILVIGIGGANGTTMLSGILANRNNVTWYGPRGEGPMEPNYNGCITQLNQKGTHGGVGYKDKVPGLADVTMAAVGGWDIRPTKLGDALFRDQVLDYDLVKQVRDDMNMKYTVFKGLYDPRFIGSSQHKGATHVLSEEDAPHAAEALKCIRADIRYFKWKNGVVGHTTVIWSASVEPNCPFCMEDGGLDTAADLMKSIEQTEEERGGPLPPSLIYATAAILEGCSFVNGGSQNTLCKGLADLAKHQLGVYCLGTDFKAGQTKFKTAAVEYLRTMGLTPKVIASSNHLGNNDMHNLATGDTARKAKLRVKHDIFAAWEEDIDHKVSIMYTPMINDEKRDFVEYTSLGFLNQHHTMMTYTRASDSVLCVPLMIDAAVWCDYFSKRIWDYENVAKALAYLFKVPEGAAKGVDPGFFRQMQELDKQVMAAASTDTSKMARDSKRNVRIKEKRLEGTVTEWLIPSNNSNIVCAGLACVDMQLLSATGGDGGENIESFEGEKSMGGGSVSMACKTLARLCYGEPLDEDFMEISPPVVNSVIPFCKVGCDDSGNKLIQLLEATGESCRNVETTYMKNARKRDVKARTALAVLPIYKDGRRGCFFDAASSATFAAPEMVEMINEVSTSTSSEESENSFGAFIFGYPHLLPMMQGEALAHIFSKARGAMENGGIIVLDLNGVPEQDSSSNSTPWGSMCSVSTLQADPILGPALSHVDILHMNEDELQNLTGVQLIGKDDDEVISGAASLFLDCGVAVVAITRGKKGCFIRCNTEERFASSKMLPNEWIDQQVIVEAAELPPNAKINTNGAGDAFTSGLLVAAMLRHTGLCIPVKTANNIPASPHPKKLETSEMQDTFNQIEEKQNDDGQDEIASDYTPSEKGPTEDETALATTDSDKWGEGVGETLSRNPYLVNRSMNLEQAAQFACLVAARHVDMSTRDSSHLDITALIEESIVSHSGLEEI